MAAEEIDLNLEVRLPSLDGQLGKVWSLSWSPCPCNGSEEMLASCGDVAVVWHCQSSLWSQMEQLNTRTKGPLIACAWKSDGLVLATGGSDSQINLWEYKKEKNLDGAFECIATIPVPHQEIIKSLSWSYKGSLLSCTSNGCICIVGSRTNEEDETVNYNVLWRKGLPEKAEVSCCEWHPEGRVFALGAYETTNIYRTEHNSDKDFTANDIHENGTMRTHTGDVNSISFWTDGSVLLAAGDDQLKFVNVKGINDSKTIDRIIGTLEHKGVMCCDWSRCFEESFGYLIASGSCKHCIRLSVQCHHEDNKAEYRLVTRKIDAHDGPITSIKWHPKKPRILASTGFDGVIKIWRVTGSVPYRIVQVNASIGRWVTLGEQYEVSILSRNIKPRRSFPGL